MQINVKKICTLCEILSQNYHKSILKRLQTYPENMPFPARKQVVYIMKTGSFRYKNRQSTFHRQTITIY